MRHKLKWWLVVFTLFACCLTMVAPNIDHIDNDILSSPTNNNTNLHYQDVQLAASSTTAATSLASLVAAYSMPVSYHYNPTAASQPPRATTTHQTYHHYHHQYESSNIHNQPQATMTVAAAHHSSVLDINNVLINSQTNSDINKPTTTNPMKLHDSSTDNNNNFYTKTDSRTTAGQWPVISDNSVSSGSRLISSSADRRSPVVRPSSVTPTASTPAVETLTIGRRASSRLHQRAAPEPNMASTSPECEKFVIGDRDTKTFYSPGYPNNYPNKTDCVVVLEAPPGSLLRLDFRDHFNIEPSPECKYDYIEIRDGAHGYSTLLGQFCDHEFPPMLTSKDRYLWLHFHSDDNIEYKGFVAVYDFVPRPTSSIYDDGNCRIEKGGIEGFINDTDVPRDKIDLVKEHNLALDCMWIINVFEGWKIQLSIPFFKLEKPNDCESNFVDVFSEKTDLPSRLKNFCGTAADAVTSKSNILHIRYFAEHTAINSQFGMIYTAFRDKDKDESFCNEDEFDCDDATCIHKNLTCNERRNCRFNQDEEAPECHQTKGGGQSEHVIIIIIIFGLILGGMFAIFLFNCVRKIVRDHKIIRNNIQQSRESKLDEIGRLSSKKSRENLQNLLNTKLPPQTIAYDKDSPTTILHHDIMVETDIPASTINHFYPHHQHHHSLHQHSLPPLPHHMTHHQHLHHSHSHESSAGSDAGGKVDNSSTRSHQKQGSMLSHHHPQQQQQQQQSHDSDIDQSRNKEAEMCDMACQTRESLFQTPTIGFRDNAPSSQSPHQHSHSVGSSSAGNAGIRFSTFGYDDNHSPQPPSNASVQSSKPSTCSGGGHQHHHHYLHNNKVTTAIQMDNFGVIDDRAHDPYCNKSQKKYMIKCDELASSMSDIRKSAPDVIIMTSH